MEPERSDGFLGNTLVLLALASILLMGILSVTAEPLLRAMGAKEAVLTAALEYMRLIIAGTAFQLLATGFAPLLRNYNRAFLAMSAMIAGFVTNILLDWLLVSVFQRGMAGAALATIIGQGVTVVPCLIFMIGRVRGLGKKIYLLRKDLVGQIVRTGLSPFGLAISPQLVLALMNKSASAYGGDTAVAAYAVAAYVTCTIQLLLQGVGDGSQPLISLYWGRGEEENVRKIRGLAYLFSVLTAVGAILVILPLCEVIPGFFGASQQAVPLIRQCIPVFTAGFVLIAFCRTTTAYFYASQKQSLSYLMVYGEPLLLCLLLTLVLPRIWGLSGVWASVPVAQGGVTVLGTLFLLKERREKRLAMAVESCDFSQ